MQMLLHATLGLSAFQRCSASQWVAPMLRLSGLEVHAVRTPGLDSKSHVGVYQS